MHSQDATLSPLFDLVLLSNDANIPSVWADKEGGEAYYEQHSQLMELAVVLV